MVEGLKVRVRAERREIDRSMVGSRRGNNKGGGRSTAVGPRSFGGEKVIMGEFPEENTRFGKHRPVRSEGLLSMRWRLRFSNDKGIRIGVMGHWFVEIQLN